MKLAFFTHEADGTLRQQGTCPSEVISSLMVPEGQFLVPCTIEVLHTFSAQDMWYDATAKSLRAKQECPITLASNVVAAGAPLVFADVPANTRVWVSGDPHLVVEAGLWSLILEEGAYTVWFRNGPYKDATFDVEVLAVV